MANVNLSPSVVCPLLGYLPGDPPLIAPGARGKDVSIEYVNVSAAEVESGLAKECDSVSFAAMRFAVANGGTVTLRAFLDLDVPPSNKKDRAAIAERIRTLAQQKLDAPRERHLEQPVLDYLAACKPMLASLETAQTSRVAAHTLVKSWGTATAEVKPVERRLLAIRRILASNPELNAPFLTGAQVAMTFVASRLDTIQQNARRVTADTKAGLPARLTETAQTAAARAELVAKLDAIAEQKDGIRFYASGDLGYALDSGFAIAHYQRFGEVWMKHGRDGERVPLCSFAEIVATTKTSETPDAVA